MVIDSSIRGSSSTYQNGSGTDSNHSDGPTTVGNTSRRGAPASLITCGRQPATEQHMADGFFLILKDGSRLPANGSLSEANAIGPIPRLFQYRGDGRNTVRGD